MSYRSAGSLGLVLFVAGCSHSVLDVRSKPNGGVPFYPLEQVETKVAVYEQRWWEIKVEATIAVAESKPGGSAETKKPTPATQQKPQKPAEVKKPSESDAPESKPKEWTRSLVMMTADEGVATDFARSFALKDEAQAAFEEMAIRAKAKTGLIDVTPPALDWAGVTGSKWKPVGVTRTRTIRPAAKPMYANAMTPWGGSGKGSFELGSDGTLRKFDGEQTDSLPSTVSSFVTGLVGSDAATAIVNKIAGASTAESATGQRYLSAKITVTPIRRMYTLSVSSVVSEDGSVAPCDLAAAAPSLGTGSTAAACQGTLAIKVVRGEDDNDKAEKDDGKKIKFSGSVALPEEKKDEE